MLRRFFTKLSSAKFACKWLGHELRQETIFGVYGAKIKRQCIHCNFDDTDPDYS